MNKKLKLLMKYGISSPTFKIVFIMPKIQHAPKIFVRGMTGWPEHLYKPCYALHKTHTGDKTYHDTFKSFDFIFLGSVRFQFLLNRLGHLWERTNATVCIKLSEINKPKY